MKKWIYALLAAHALLLAYQWLSTGEAAAQRPQWGEDLPVIELLDPELFKKK